MYQRLAGPRLGRRNVDQAQCIVAAAASPCMAFIGHLRRWPCAPLVARSAGVLSRPEGSARHENHSDLSILLMLASQSRIT